MLTMHLMTSSIIMLVQLHERILEMAQHYTKHDGSLNGTVGIFEWIIQNGMTTHRMFVPGGTMNGVPIIP